MITINDFHFIKFIGKGSFGTIYKAIKKDNNEICAIKKIKIINLNHYEKKYIINEIRMLASHICNNLIKYLNVFLHSDHIYIVTEYAANGDLLQIIKKHKSQNTIFKEHEIWEYFIQICLGLQYLHKNNIIHRDIKSSNIFINSNNKIKIGDLGAIKIMPTHILTTRTQIGTPYYMAPEIHNQEKYTEKCDIWSLGCVLYEMIFLTTPFSGTSMYNLKYNIIQGKYNINSQICNIHFKQLLKKMLITNSTCRSSITDMLTKSIITTNIKNIDQSYNIKSIFNESCRVPQRFNEWKFVINKFAINKHITPILPIPPKKPRPPSIAPRPSNIFKSKHPIKQDYNIVDISNNVNKELIILNKQIQDLTNNINLHKNIINTKLSQLNYYNKKRLEIIKKNKFNINKLNPTKNKIEILSKDKLLIKIGSRHEPNYFLN